MGPWVAGRWSLVAGIALLLLSLLRPGMAAQTGKPSSATKPNHTTTEPAPSAADQAEIDALRSDLLRMRSILDQLRNNLGYVSSTTQPLRHQFELEIDMWQIQMGQTERRLQRLEGQARH